MSGKYLFLIFFIFLGCYQVPELENFDLAKWDIDFTRCSDNRLDQGLLIVEQKEQLLGSGQAIIKKLLGQPAENELYRRNQKFFYYELTAGDTCESIIDQKRLSIRFDALDRAKEISIIVK